MTEFARERLKTLRADLEKRSVTVTRWIGSTSSLILHSLLFAGSFVLPYFGFDLDRILLVLTTAVSLEAIYLAIFIQMTVNRNTQSLVGVEEDIGEIQEEVRELGEDVEEISEDIDKIQEEEGATAKTALEKIESNLQKVLADIEALKQKQ